MSTVGILSTGEMGLGIAKLLRAHGFPVVTTLGQRSEATKLRAASAGVKVLADDAALVGGCDVLLSIVPPRDAHATAQRVKDVARVARGGRGDQLVYVDLNAVSPRSARAMAESLASLQDVVFIDGGIIGGPPKSQGGGTGDAEWTRPSLVVSGPQQLRDVKPDGAHLADVLNMRHVSATVGTASGLKMCFASMTKGFTAIAIQSFTTAHALGVHDELQRHLAQFSPKTGDLAEKGLTGMPPKAYRWVAEMQQIAETFREEGGFESALFDEVADVYGFVADETVLGEEKTEGRVRGKTTEDVALLVREGLERKAKTD